MKVIVPVKPVADANTAPSAWIKAQEGDPEGVNFVANEFDLIAVEQAIRLRDQGVEDICIVTIAHESMMTQMRSAIAMGADRAVLVDPGDQPRSSYEIAAALKYVVEKEQPAFVLMGKQATDDDAAQVGPLLAGMLGWPQATFVSEMAFDEAKTRLTAGREVDEGIEVIEVKLPAIVTCDLRLNEPRYATLPNLIKSKRKPVERLKWSELGIGDEVKVTVRSRHLPPGRSGEVKMVTDAHELVTVLKDMRALE